MVSQRIKREVLKEKIGGGFVGRGRLGEGKRGDDVLQGLSFQKAGGNRKRKRSCSERKMVDTHLGNLSKSGSWEEKKEKNGAKLRVTKKRLWTTGGNAINQKRMFRPPERIFEDGGGSREWLDSR